MKLKNVLFVVSDIEKSKAFYQELLHFEQRSFDYESRQQVLNNLLSACIYFNKIVT